MSKPRQLDIVEEFERRYVHPRPGRTLVVGSRVYEGRADRRKLYADAEGWDAIEGEGVDRVVDLDLPLFNPEQFAHVDCISVLEHAERPWRVAENIEGLMRMGSTLYVAVPFIWRIHSYPKDFWRFTMDGLRLLFCCIEWHTMKYVNVDLADEGTKILSERIDDHPYFARTEICAFGRKTSG